MKVQKSTWIKFLSSIKYAVMNISVDSLSDSQLEEIESNLSLVLEDIPLKPEEDDIYIKMILEADYTIAFLLTSIPISYIIVNDAITYAGVVDNLKLTYPVEIMAKIEHGFVAATIEGTSVKQEITEELLKQQLEGVTFITKAEWDAEYNRVLNLYE